MKIHRTLISALAVLPFAFVGVACDDGNGLEEAGETADDVIDDAADAIDDAADEIDDAVDDATDGQ